MLKSHYARYLTSLPRVGECSQFKCTISYLHWTSGVGGNAKIKLNARYLNSHCPSGVGGMLKSQLKCTISNSHWTSGVGGNAKSQQMHDILILTEPVELVKINLKHHSHCPVELVGMLKSQLKCTISNSHWTSGVGGMHQNTTISFLTVQWSWWNANHNLNARLNSHCPVELVEC
jgi:hypothetical protein